MKNLLIRVGLLQLPGVYPVDLPTCSKFRIMGEVKARNMKNTADAYVLASWLGMGIAL